jgi:hypothetical protein
MVASPKGLGPEKHYAGKGQQHIHKTEASSPNHRLQHKRGQQGRTHESNARVVDTLENGCQTEVQMLDLGASNRSFQAAKSGSYENTTCKGGAASSTTLPPAASMSDGSTDGQSEECSICLRGFVTQDAGAPEACDHTFCADSPGMVEEC